LIKEKKSTNKWGFKNWAMRESRNEGIVDFGLEK
jgi:hypothetical protein